MITKTLLVAALAIVAAGSSLAGGLTAPDTHGEGKSTLTRAEVTAEYVRAKQAGELDWANNFYNPNRPQAMSSVTRADVAREVQRARAAGEIAGANIGFSYPPQQQRAVQ